MEQLPPLRRKTGEAAFVNGVITTGKRAFRWLFQLFYPRRCVLCRDPLPTGTSGMICDACAPRVRAEYRNSVSPDVEGADGADAPLLYERQVAAALKRYKFQGDTSLCRWFSAHAAVCLSTHLAEWEPELITYVPLGVTRWWSRGFNQSRAIARRLGKALGLPVKASLAKKPRKGKQSRRSVGQRRRAVQGLFFALPGHAVRGKRVVLVDDIITTGSTAADAVRALRQAGAAAVYVLAVARTAPNSERTSRPAD